MAASYAAASRSNVASLKARPMKVSPLGSPRSIAVGTVIAGVPAAAASVVDNGVEPSPLTRSMS